MNKALIVLIAIAISNSSQAYESGPCGATQAELESALRSIIDPFIAFRQSYERAYGEIGYADIFDGKISTEIGDFPFTWPDVLPDFSRYISKTQSVYFDCVTLDAKVWGCTATIPGKRVTCGSRELEVRPDDDFTSANKQRHRTATPPVL